MTGGFYPWSIFNEHRWSILDAYRQVLHPLEIVSVANEQLGEFVPSLETEGQGIMDALDELLTRAWR